MARSRYSSLPNFNHLSNSFKVRKEKKEQHVKTKQDATSSSTQLGVPKRRMDTAVLLI